MKTSQTEPGNFILDFAASRPFTTTLIGGLLMFCSFAPVGFAPLAWFALIPWLALIGTPQFKQNRPWRAIWIGGLLFWAAETYYVTIPHWLLWFAWVALFLYLSIYPLLFVWISRILVHDHRVPLVIAAPIVFTVLEWVRAHIMGGFGVSMLSNSQYQWTRVIQVCDIAGAYGLTFVMVMIGTGALMLLMIRRNRLHLGSIVTAVLALAFVMYYGTWRTNQINESILHADKTDPVGIMVIQGNIDTNFPATQAEYDAYMNRRLREYAALQKKHYWGEDMTGHTYPHLVIWPEGKYPIPDVLPWSNGVDDESMRATFRQFHELLFNRDEIRPVMIVGGVSFSSNEEEYNSALLLNPDGEVEDRYFKMQRVPFGEYVPFHESIPVLERTPIGRGITAGDAPVSFVVRQLRFSPNICFESCVSHLIRDSVNQLASRDEEPDVLVNLTDDGWFYGTAALDHHLACNVMRAVENRKPVVVAANTGLSASIGASGEIVVQGKRREEEVLEFVVRSAFVSSIYRVVGDWPPLTLATICVIAILTRRRGRGWVERNREASSE